MGFQALNCKKCGEGNLYHPKEGEDTGNWPRIDKFGNVQAFEEGFDVPHWYICDATTQGTEHRQRLEGEMSEFQKRRNVKREEIQLEKTPIHPPGQVRLPSERLSPLDKKIAEKINVLQMCIDDIRALLHQKAQSDI